MRLFGQYPDHQQRFERTPETSRSRCDGPQLRQVDPVNLSLFLRSTSDCDTPQVSSDRHLDARRLRSPVNIVKAHDVVFLQIRATLDLNDLERNFAGILKSMPMRLGDIGRL